MASLFDVAGILMEHFEQIIPFEQFGLFTEFREVNRDVVLNEHKEQKENILQFFASLTQSTLELELQRDKAEREKSKQELIATWKGEREQNQQETRRDTCEEFARRLRVWEWFSIVILSIQYCHSERKRRISREGLLDSSLTLRMTS